MEKSMVLVKQFVSYVSLIALVLWLFSPVLGNLVEDWSHPIAVKKHFKDQAAYQKAHADWQDKKKQTEKKKQSFNEAEPKFCSVRWAIDDYDMVDSPKFFFKKIGLPWQPNVIIVLLAYPLCFCLWRHYYRKSEIFFLSSGYSDYKRPLTVCALTMLAVTATAFAISVHTELAMATQDQQLLQAAQKILHTRMGGMPIGVVFPMLFIGVIMNFLTVLFSDLIMYKLSKSASPFTPFYRVLLGRLTGKRIRIRSDGSVIISSTELEVQGLRPRLRRTEFKLTLPEFLYYLRGVLLSNVSSQFLKGCRQEITDGLRHKFLALNRQSRGMWSGEAIPQDLRFLTKAGNKTIAVIQEKPRVHSVSFAPLVMEKERAYLKKHDELKHYPKDLLEGNTLELAFPYCIFVVVLDRGEFEALYAYWSPASLNSLTDSIYQFPLHNIREDGHVCLGYEGRLNLPLAEICDQVVASFWDNHFSYHHHELFEGFRDTHKKMSSLFAWHLASADNPNFVRRIDMRRVKFERTTSKLSYDTLQELINELTDGERDMPSRMFDDFVDDVLTGKPLSLKILESKVEMKATIEQIYDVIQEERA
jgi:hypothetical protein